MMTTDTQQLPVPRPARVGGVLAMSAAILMLLAAMVSCLWRPDMLAAMTLIPPWCCLVPGTITTLLVWRLRHRRFAIVALAFWILFTLGWVEETRSVVHRVFGSIRTASGPDWRSLRIVSMNCAGSVRCLEDLQRQNPDIALLQEVPGGKDLSEIARELFGQSGAVLEGGDTAILARGRIEPRFVDRSAHLVAGTVILRDGLELECISLRLSPPPARFDFWAAGFWREHRDLRQVHRRQLEQVIGQLDQIPAEGALLIAGDFNTTPLDRALDLLRPLLKDAFAEAGQGVGGTGTNDWPLFRVDQVWINAAVTCRLVQSKRTISSDHRLVVCDLWLPPRRPR